MNYALYIFAQNLAFQKMKKKVLTSLGLSEPSSWQKLGQKNHKIGRKSYFQTFTYLQNHHSVKMEQEKVLHVILSDLLPSSNKLTPVA